MGADKDSQSPVAKYLRFLPFAIDDGSIGKAALTPASGLPTRTSSADEIRSGWSPVSTDGTWSDHESAGFDIADDLEKGLADEAVLSQTVRNPVQQGQRMQRYTIIYQETTDEYHLMSESLDLLLVGRQQPKEGRVDFYFSSETRAPSDPGSASPSSDRPPVARRPAFTMTYNEAADEWTLLQPRCQSCVHRPRHLTCEYLGKAQQVAAIKHSRKKVGQALVHHVDVTVPPLLDGKVSAVWCPALFGKDLGGRSPAASALRSQSGSLSPKKERSNPHLLHLLDAEPLALRTRMPVWDPEVESLVLNFQERTNLSSSPRNFMLSAGNGQGAAVVLQHAKIGRSTWCLDFAHPLSVLQAFAVAMSSLDWD